MAKQFVYRKRTVEDVKAQADVASSGGRDRYIKPGITFFKPKQGLNTVRILPPSWENAEHYGYRVAMHYGVGVDNGSYICPHHTVNPETGRKEDCPICEEGDKKASHRVLVYVIDRSESKPIPKLWNMPASVDADILKLSIDNQTNEILPVDDPFEGYDVEVTVEGDGERTKYKIAIARRPTEIKNFEDDIWPKICDEKALPSLLIFQDYDYLSKVYNGKTNPSEESKQPASKGKTVNDLAYDTLLKIKSMAGLDKVLQEYNVDFDASAFNDYEDAVNELASQLGFTSDDGNSDSADSSGDDTPDDDQPVVVTKASAPAAKSDLKDRLAAIRNKNK